MDFLTKSLAEAAGMLVSLDPELYFIVYVSLKVSLMSTLIASVLDVPLGFFIAIRHFRGKRGVITLLNTLLALSTVVIGLIVDCLCPVVPPGRPGASGPAFIPLPPLSWAR